MAWALVAVFLALWTTADEAETAGVGEEASTVPAGFGSVLEALGEQRMSGGAETLRVSNPLNVEAADWAEKMAAGPGVPRLDDVLERLESRGNRQRRLFVAILQSSDIWPPSAEVWSVTAPDRWETLLDPAFREIGCGTAKTPEGGSVWVLLVGQSQNDSVQPALERLADRKAVRQEMLAAVNRERSTVGLGRLRKDRRLDRAAQRYADLMARTGHYGHDGPDGSSVAERALLDGYRYRQIGENLGAGQETVDEVMLGWMASPGHRKNILDPAYLEMGVGVAWGEFEDGTRILWVQMFGTP